MYSKTFSAVAIGLLLAVAAEASAYDFAEGKFFYNVLDEAKATVEVTFEETPNPFFVPSYEGEMEVPAEVTHNGKTYTVEAIGEQAFYGCDKLTGLTLPATIKSIGRIAFSMDLSLASINLPEGLETIGNSAFFFCTKIPYFHIPASVTLIDDNAFFECQSISEYKVAEDNKCYASYDGVLYDKSFKNLLWVPAKKTTVDVAPATEVIRTNSFSTCRELEHVTLPESLKVIGKSAFTGCVALKDLNLPASVDSIGRYAFVGCYALSELNVAPGNKNYASIDGVLYNKDITTLLRFPCAKTSVTIPSGIEVIGEMAFSDCIKIGEVTFPNSVRKVEDYGFNVCSVRTLRLNDDLESIGESGFGGNSLLTTLHIPSSVTFVGNSVFSGCSSLQEVTGGEGLTAIVNNMFSSCTSLKSFTVPANVTSIDDNAFYECSSLQSISFNDKITKIGNSAFFKCTLLDNVTLPQIPAIEPYAFFQCESLKLMEIPASVTSVGASAFYNSGLESVVIGENVAAIESRALYASSLKEVTVLAQTPPTAVSNSFANATYNNSTLYVPTGCEEQYRAATVWKKFADIKGKDLSAVENLPADGDGTIDVYSLSGTMIFNKVPKENLQMLQPGIYIIKEGNATRKVSIRN